MFEKITNMFKKSINKEMLCNLDKGIEQKKQKLDQYNFNFCLLYPQTEIAKKNSGVCAIFADDISKLYSTKCEYLTKYNNNWYENIKKSIEYIEYSIFLSDTDETNIKQYDISKYHRLGCLYNSIDSDKAEEIFELYKQKKKLFLKRNPDFKNIQNVF